MGLKPEASAFFVFLGVLELFVMCTAAMSSLISLCFDAPGGAADRRTARGTPLPTALLPVSTAASERGWRRRRLRQMADDP